MSPRVPRPAVGQTRLTESGTGANVRSTAARPFTSTTRCSATMRTVIAESKPAHDCGGSEVLIYVITIGVRLAGWEPPEMIRGRSQIA
jgi:hypothetical protein